MADTPLSAERLTPEELREAAGACRAFGFGASDDLEEFWGQIAVKLERLAGQWLAWVEAAQQAESLRAERDELLARLNTRTTERDNWEAEVSRLRGALTRSHYVRPNEGEAG